MLKINSFIEGFQRDHTELLELITSFRKAIESAQRSRAKDILNKIDALALRHFNFEETYLYPRLRRLVSEITENLHNKHAAMREFIEKSREILKGSSLNKTKAYFLFDTTSKLSKIFEECNGLAHLAKEFNNADKEDLNKRFKECHELKV